MARSLSSCWKFIENFLLIDGFQKWYRLSFFIHPLLLVIIKFFLLAQHIISLVAKLAAPCRRIISYSVRVVVAELIPYLRKIFFSSSSERDRLALVVYVDDQAEEHEQSPDQDYTIFVWREGCCLVLNKHKLQKVAAANEDEDQEDYEEEDKYFEFEDFEKFFDAVEEDASDKKSSIPLLLEEDHEQSPYQDYSIFVWREGCCLVLHQHKLKVAAEDEEDVQQDYEEEKYFEIEDFEEFFDTVEEDASDKKSSIPLPEAEEQKQEHEEENISVVVSDDEEQQQQEQLPEQDGDDDSLCSNLNENRVEDDRDSHQQEEVIHNTAETKRENNIDIFYQNYTEKMWWFDQLNTHRIFAIGSILNKKLGNASLLETIQPMDFSLLESTAGKDLAKSLKSDLELVYVAQASLNWEALQYQYRKVEPIARNSNKLFNGEIAAKFQTYQVLLVKFLEIEGEGNRFWNYAHTRFSVKELLQVPEVSDPREGTDERNLISARKVLEEIEQAIGTFWEFLKKDVKKSKSFKETLIQKFLSFDQQVEDPKDLYLLDKLTKQANKMKVGLKELKNQRRNSAKRTSTIEEEEQTIQVFFSMIDTEIVTRVLKMSVITSEELIWCQEKLENIHIIADGGRSRRVRRNWNDGRLFPHA